MSGFRNAIRDLAHQRGEWAGIPMPLEGERLVVEPSYPSAAALGSIGKPTAEEDAEESRYKIRNRWWSMARRGSIVIFEVDGKITWGFEAGIHHLAYDMTTLGCSHAWGLEQESNAVHLLGTILRHRQFKQYLLTGMFMERSQRSGLTYLFRRLKPTVVIDARIRDSKESTRILCCLCMHPIAYYAGSWAGAMTPTDDVVAHLSLMRGDEHMLWRRSNQHPPWRPEAGL